MGGQTNEKDGYQRINPKIQKHRDWAAKTLSLEVKVIEIGG